MNLKQSVENYVPSTHEEAVEKEMILKYFDEFDDLLTRDNGMVHFVSSAFIVNKSKTKVLLIHHNLFNSWICCGGHCDGDGDALRVALKEANEETGLKNFKVLDEGIWGLEILPVDRHYKRGKYITSHVHLSLMYIIEADEDEMTTIKPDENTGVAWFDLQENNIDENKPDVYGVYKKLIDKMKLKFDLSENKIYN